MADAFISKSAKYTELFTFKDIYRVLNVSSTMCLSLCFEFANKKGENLNKFN